MFYKHIKYSWGILVCRIYMLVFGCGRLYEHLHLHASESASAWASVSVIRYEGSIKMRPHFWRNEMFFFATVSWCLAAIFAMQLQQKPATYILSFLPFFCYPFDFFLPLFDRFWWKEKVGCNIWLNVVGRVVVVAAAGVDVAAVAFMLNNVLFMALTITAARHGLLWPGLGFQWWLKWWCSWYFSWYLLYGMVLMVVAFWATKSCCQNVLCCKYIYMYR